VEQVKLFMAMLFMLLGLFTMLNAFRFNEISLSNLIGLVFFVPAMLLLMDVRYMLVVLDKSGVSKIVSKKFGKTELINFATSDVVSVRKKEYLGIGNGSSKPNDYLQFKIKSQGYVDIAYTRQNTLRAKILRPYRRQGQKVAEFLGVPFEIKTINLLKEFIKDTNQDEPS